MNARPLWVVVVVLLLSFPLFGQDDGKAGRIQAVRILNQSLRSSPSGFADRARLLRSLMAPLSAFLTTSTAAALWFSTNSRWRASVK